MMFANFEPFSTPATSKLFGNCGNCDFFSIFPTSKLFWISRIAISPRHPRLPSCSELQGLWFLLDLYDWQGLLNLQGLRFLLDLYDWQSLLNFKDCGFFSTPATSKLFWTSRIVVSSRSLRLGISSEPAEISNSSSSVPVWRLFRVLLGSLCDVFNLHLFSSLRDLHGFLFRKL